MKLVEMGRAEPNWCDAAIVNRLVTSFGLALEAEGAESILAGWRQPPGID